MTNKSCVDIGTAYILSFILLKLTNVIPDSVSWWFVIIGFFL